LRTIFLDKNIGCYRRYIGPISLSPVKPAWSVFVASSAAAQHRRRSMQHLCQRGFDPVFTRAGASDDAPP
jgi:hypothetical protein